MNNYSVFDNLLEGVQVISEDLRYLYLNQSVKEQAGISQRDVIGMKCEEVFPGIEESNAFVLVRKCLATGQALNELNKFEFPDGSNGYFELRLNRIPEGVLLFSMDQTENKRKEEMLQMSYERYETITAATHSALFEWNVDEKIVFGNSIFHALCEKYKGKRCASLSEVLALGEQKNNEHFRSKLRETISQKGENFAVYLEQNSQEEGNIAFQLNVVISYNNEGEPIGFIGFILDATENLRSLKIKEMNNTFSNMFLSDRSLDDCLNEVLDQLISFSGEFRVGEFWLPNHEQTVFRRKACFSAIGNENEKLCHPTLGPIEFAYGMGLPGRCAAKNEIIWLNYLEKHEFFVRKELILDSGLDTGVAIPIISNQKLVAVLSLFSEGKVLKRKDLIELITNISENIGHGIMSKRIAHQRDLLNDSDTMILLNTTPAGKIIRMNPIALKMFLPTQIPETKFDLFSLIDKKSTKEFKKKWNALISHTIDVIDTSVVIITSSGKRRTLKINATRCADDDTVYLIGLDITKEIELLELLSLFNDMASIGFWSIDLLTWETVLSGNIQKVLMIDESVELKVKNGEFLKQIIPEALYSESIDSLLSEQKTIDINWEQNNGGETKQIRLIAQSEFKDGLCARISGIVQDITFIVRTEQELEKAVNNYLDLFDQNPIPMWLYDPETLKYQMVNRKACEIYGYSLEEYKNLTLLDLRAKSEHAEVLKANKAILKSETDAFMGNFKHLTKKGKTLLMDIYARVVDFKGKKQILVMGIDRTESILLQKEMSKAVLKAEEMQREEISRELHDNVCQLLVAAQMYLSLHDDETNQHFKFITPAMEMLESANKETRELSHSLSAQIFRNQGIKESIHQVVETFKANDELHINIDLNNDFKTNDFSGEIKLNLIRILQEALANIQKYSKATEVNIIGEIREDNLQFVITDNGVGFDLKKIKKGIGLYNIRKRVEILNGAITILSSPGNGTTIKMNIPLKEEVTVFS